MSYFISVTSSNTSECCSTKPVTFRKLTIDVNNYEPDLSPLNLNQKLRDFGMIK